ncbi:MAG: SIMPL domain-containing protein [Candidatus Eisenbacteria bacterium]|uniref:SIMPL domain-containing protein n=1 Tax=Eiseniibacteriota bacterium TaxID=2212470 RepID=A0A938BR83_UNCEI|nr:SIMPL domain-containing protein [Candidatus Eisenbacteria bacterium]
MKGAVSWVAAAILAAGLIAGGASVGRGLAGFRTADRFVTVKGLAEREVLADVALWPLRFSATHDDLAQAQARIRRSQEAILGFLGRQGVEMSQVELQNLEVTDLLANPWRSPGPIESRFIIRQTLMVRTNEPEKIERAGQAVGELVEAGVVLTSEGGPSLGPTYLFTRLNDLKPEMIREATANARRAAEQFAHDSGSRVGRIRQANQGAFVILARDQAPGVTEEGQRRKTVRVVSTIEFFLED